MTDPTVATVDQFDNTSFDDYYRHQNLEIGAESMRRVPRHYADAVASLPEVRSWMTALIRDAAYSTGPMPAFSSGRSILLLGSTGTGKTHEAYGAVRALCVSGARPSWTFSTAADIYAKLRPRHGVDSEAEFERYAKSALLVVDDIGAAKGSEWNEEINYRLINHRYENELPTLITSNVPPPQLRTVLGERVSSRLTEMCDHVAMKGNDRRRVA